MEEKKADNVVLNKKAEISKIELEVDRNKKLLSSLDSVEENFRELRKNIENCIDLLNNSIKGANVQRQLAAISEENVDSYNTSMKNIYEKRDELNTKIKDLYNKKDKINDEIKDIYKEELKEE